MIGNGVDVGTSRAFSEKVRRAAASGQLVLLSDLTLEASSRTAAETEEFVLSSAGTFVRTSSKVSAATEAALTYVHWAFARTRFIELLQSVGKDDTVPFWINHFNKVENLYLRASPIAAAYCLRVRESHAADPTSDPSVMNHAFVAELIEERHFPADPDCTATETVTGRRCAERVRGQENSLLDEHGNEYCRRFAIGRCANGRDYDFPTEWGTFDQCRTLILSLPPGTVAATFDVVAAYRNTPIYPPDQNWVVVQWDGQFWIDRAASGIGPCIKWVDDFALFRTPEFTFTEDEFEELSARWGVRWNRKKRRDFASVVRYIGFDWDLDARTVAFPTDKRMSLLALIDSWLTPHSRFNAKEAATLHGKLIHASSVIPISRPFIPSSSRFANSFLTARGRLNPSNPLLADLRWIRDLIAEAPPAMPLRDPTPVDVGWWGDASTSFGIGLVIGTSFCVWRWADGFRPGPRRSDQRDIGWAEAVAVELGLTLLQIILPSLFPSSTLPASLLVRSDNSGVSIHMPPSENVFLSARLARRFHPTHYQSEHRHKVLAKHRLLAWKPVVAAEPSHIDSPLFSFLANRAAMYSLKDTGTVGSAIAKHETFCNIFGIPLADRFPSCYRFLHSFVLWACTDVDDFAVPPPGVPFDPIAPNSASSYLASIETWHAAHSLPPPLSQAEKEHIQFSLRGLRRLEAERGRRTKEKRPGVVLEQVRVLGTWLNLDDPFDAAVWAAILTAFFGVARVGEVTVRSREAFNPNLHSSGADIQFGNDRKGSPYASIRLPSAKTAEIGVSPNEMEHDQRFTSRARCPSPDLWGDSAIPADLFAGVPIPSSAASAVSTPNSLFDEDTDAGSDVDQLESSDNDDEVAEPVARAPEAAAHAPSPSPAAVPASTSAATTRPFLITRKDKGKGKENPDRKTVSSTSQGIRRHPAAMMKEKGVKVVVDGPFTRPEGWTEDVWGKKAAMERMCGMLDLRFGRVPE
ncbi:hypothetical protein RQP46_002851 [Phenoliferia psychrophenolica]